MPDVHFYTAAADTDAWVDAGIALAIAIVIAKIVDHLIARRGEAVSEMVSRGELSPATRTRLRLVRRLVTALILLIGAAVAASNFPELSSAARAILASSAVLGIVVGFAARQTLANAIAGILLAITQPIRIGDLVTFEEETGTVEDMRLTYTYIRSDDGRRYHRAERAPGPELDREPHDRRPARPGGGVRLAPAGRRPRHARWS